ncbi:unnamed protein product, partial [Allacma fusca]
MITHLVVIHVFGSIGIVQIAQGRVLFPTLIFAYVLAESASYSITIGCHRLFAHRTFKATPLLKNSLALCNFFAGQNSIWLWCAWHRLHHKCTDTDEDPHNATREQEPVIMFQERYYPFISIVQPTYGDTDLMTHQLTQEKTYSFPLLLL